MTTFSQSQTTTVPASSTPVSTGDIVMCPGQGAQHVGMGRDWAARWPVAAETFNEANEILGFDLADLCFRGPEDQLNRTDYAQAAIYTTSVACYRVLRQEGLLGPLAATAGLSLGEFTALHLAGAYSFADGLKLVRLRGVAMQEAAEATPSGMVALIGAEQEQAQTLCLAVLERVAGENQVLVPANFNCPSQVVISGSKAACECALTVATEMNLQAKALAVAGAFHSPIMQPAAARLGKALEQVRWTEPGVQVLSNVSGQPHDITNVESIKGLLVEQLTRPVQWEKSIRWSTIHLSGRYVELAPGKVLSGLMKRINRRTAVHNFAEPAPASSPAAQG
ncbi:MAG: ACP S-malonyltransferase [Phycisphaeraceae bacterium]|nr:ACP S-malonyltransferase [Phycisphaeraceae bacterium]